MMIYKITAIFCLSTVLWACSKSSEKPISDIPANFRSSTSSYQLVAKLPYTAWWQQFKDPLLNQLIQDGLNSNRDIEVALGHLQEAKGMLKEVKLSWIPTVQLWAGYSTNPALGVPGSFYAAWPTYTLNILQLYAQQKQATFNMMYYQAAVEGVRLTVIGQIAGAYFTLMAQSEQLRLLQQLDGDLNELIRLSQKDLAIGLADELTIAQLQSDEQLVRSQMLPVQQNKVASENALRYLLNKNPGAVANKNNFASIDFGRIKPGSLPAAVLNNRPDMRMAWYALKAAHANVLSAYSTFFPIMQLDDFIGEIDAPKQELAQAVDSYGIVNLALSNLGRIDASKGKQAAALAEFQKTIKRILKEVDTDYEANKQKNQQYLDYKKALKLYEKKYTLQVELFNTGLISYKDLLQSKIYLDNLALAVNLAKLELALSLVLLYQDLAGGYAHQNHLEKNKLNKHADNK